MSKYKPLETYLEGLPLETRDVTLSFSQIEKIINDTLPTSARRHMEWWENEQEGRHVQAHSWMDAGWAVVSKNLSAQWVRFNRS